MQIKIENLSYVYSPRTPFEKTALKDISFTVNEGDTMGIVGATGSGKSTLSRHLNALIRIQSGRIMLGDADLSQRKVDLKAVRKKVGMLFQFPEYQLFADTVRKDVAFGPMNFGINDAEASAAAAEALSLVGLDIAEVGDKSPFELSGGQMRRVAIAGVIASKPEVLVLDEPTAGLDPAGKREILELVKKLKSSFVKTVIIVSHNMDEIAEYCNRVAVLDEGRLIADTTPDGLFNHSDVVDNTDLDYPHTVKIKRKLAKRGFVVDSPALNVEQLTEGILGRLAE